jgi:hypothetical protein
MTSLQVCRPAGNMQESPLLKRAAAGIGSTSNLYERVLTLAEVWCLYTGNMVVIPGIHVAMKVHYS